MRSPGVLWSIMIGLMMLLLVYVLDMVWFQVFGGSSATLGNGYEIQGQNYVARLQGRVLWVWPYYRNFMLGIWCFRWIMSDMFNWPNGQQGRLPFRQSVIISWEGSFSIFHIGNPLWCWLLPPNPWAQGKLPTSLLSCAATWLLVTRVSRVYLVKEGCYFGGANLLLGGRWAGKSGRVVSWEGGKGVWLDWSDKVWKMCEWSEVTSWEGQENNEVVRSERWECNEVTIWERWEGSEQERWDGI